MTVQYVMALDPGKSTGIAIGRFVEDQPLEVVFKTIVQGGVSGLGYWLHHTRDAKTIIENDCSSSFPKEYEEFEYHLDVVCENFTLRGGNFTPDLEPVRIEGMVIDHFASVVTWQAPSDKSLVGDKFLKEHGLWVTGKDVDHEDGRDANDAMLHLFAYAMKKVHLPTLRTYWRKNEKDS